MIKFEQNNDPRQEKVEELVKATSMAFIEVQERLDKVDMKMDTFTAKLNDLGGGVIEVERVTTGKGTEDEPFALSFPCDAIPNAFYELDGVLYVYMNAKRGTVAELTEDFVEW